MGTGGVQRAAEAGREFVGLGGRRSVVEEFMWVCD